MSVDAHSVLGSDEPPSLPYRQNRTELYNQQYRSARIQNHQIRANAVKLSEKESSSQFPLATTSRFTSQHSSLNSPVDSSYLSVTPAVDEFFGGAQARRVLTDQISPLRLAGHLSVLVVAAVIFAFTQIDLSALGVGSLDQVAGLSSTDASLSTINTVDRLLDSPAEAALLPASSEPSLFQRAIRPLAAILPDTSSSAVNLERVNLISEGIDLYTVQPGDTVLGIANKYGLKPETLQGANERIKKNPDLLSIGDKLRIMPVDGAIHRVQSGDTLSKIATSYNVNMETIVGYGANQLSSASAPLSIGLELIIPGGVKAYVPPQSLSYTDVSSAPAVGIGDFNWPTAGNVTQGYWSGHRALDIGSWTGAPVKATDNGRVMIAKSGWNYGYGNYVVVDHGNGFVSLYGHLNSIYVQQGESIASGQKIGTVGNTGNSTGPHLHFEIRFKDGLRNPSSYLH